MDRLSDYAYVLPEERIAQEPLADRANSRLLVLDRQTGRVRHRQFRDLVSLLEPGDLLVLNDTRVTARRLFGKRPTGGKVEVLLVKEGPDGQFDAMVRPSRRLPVGSRIEFEGGLEARLVEGAESPLRRLQFSAVGANWERVGERIRELGQTPLPPYIHTGLADAERYQTVYAQTGGSAAAPTAGLHFTEEILAALREKGVGRATVTLDVSLDTFRPVETENLDEHRMHGEFAFVPPETAIAVAACSGRIVAVGTTVVRTLESFAVGPRQLESGRKRTKLFIRPGYRFQIVDGLLTNFHLPRTSMLMMVSALAGREPVLAAYGEAVGHDYRFLSFGDAMLIA